MRPSLADWTVAGCNLLGQASFLVAGIVNITPDSFSDGGAFFAPEQALAKIKAHLSEGAQLLDIGGESTRPGATSIGSHAEMERLQPVLEALQAKPLDAPYTLCVDTFRADTAEKVLGMGVDVINDVSGGCFEPRILDVVAEHKPGYVLGHSPSRPDVMQHDPHYEDIIDSLLHHFTQQMETLIQKGLPENHIVLDPCIGFGKTLEHTATIFKSIPRLLSLGRPLYFGISRKSFIGTATGLTTQERETQTQVATALLARKGVRIHRVHSVRETLATLALTTALEELIF